MTNGSGVSRGDRSRNARLARLRELVPLENGRLTHRRAAIQDVCWTALRSFRASLAAI
jgi:hypothetical protein